MKLFYFFLPLISLVFISCSDEEPRLHGKWLKTKDLGKVGQKEFEAIFFSKNGTFKITYRNYNPPWDEIKPKEKDPSHPAAKMRSRKPFGYHEGYHHEPGWGGKPPHINGTYKVKDHTVQLDVDGELIVMNYKIEGGDLSLSPEDEPNNADIYKKILTYPWENLSNKTQ